MKSTLTDICVQLCYSSNSLEKINTDGSALLKEIDSRYAETDILSLSQYSIAFVEMS